MEINIQSDKKLIESDMPWYSKPSTSSSGNPSCKKNLWVIQCECSTAISQRPSFLSKSPTTLHQESLLLSGNESSKKTRSTSTTSSHHSTILSLTKREQAAWVTWKSLLASLNLRNISPLLLNGPQLGGKPLEPLPSLSPP